MESTIKKKRKPRPGLPSPFTEKEKQYIIDNVGKVFVKDMAKELNCTLGQIEHFKRIRGLSKKVEPKKRKWVDDTVFNVMECENWIV